MQASAPVRLFRRFGVSMLLNLYKYMVFASSDDVKWYEDLTGNFRKRGRAQL